jgi:hypothetical protein
MGNGELERLVHELDSAPATEFWWGSELLNRCEQNRDPRVVEMLLIRHYGLQNKEADSCHLLRETIKRIDAPIFAASWSLLHAYDFESEPWRLEAAFVLGEIGGRPVLERLVGLLDTDEWAPVYVRMCLHLAGRYADLRSGEPPMLHTLDLKTGVQEDVELTKETAPPGICERAMRRRSQENELFTPVDSFLLNDLRTKLSVLDVRVLSGLGIPLIMAKDVLIDMCASIPTLDSGG